MKYENPPKKGKVSWYLFKWFVMLIVCLVTGEISGWFNFVEHWRVIPLLYISFLVMGLLERPFYLFTDYIGKILLKKEK